MSPSAYDSSSQKLCPLSEANRTTPATRVIPAIAHVAGSTRRRAATAGLGLDRAAVAIATGVDSSPVPLRRAASCRTKVGGRGFCHRAMDGRHRTFTRVLALLAFGLAVAATVALVYPIASRAAVIRFGSDLEKPANRAEAHGPDAAFWNVGGAALGNAVPADGQITQLRLKGTAVPSGLPRAPAPLTQFHFQVLHPNGDGSMSVTLSTNPMNLPADGDPNQVTTYRPDGYLCAKRGDYLDFNDEGGFVPGYYANGVPYQVFSSAPGSALNWFSKDNGTNIGATFAGALGSGEELLLQGTLATGADASPVCGGMKGKVFHGLAIARAAVNVRRGFVPVRVTCPGTAQGRCEGTLTLSDKGAVVGSIGLWVRPTTSINLHVKLSKAGQKLLKKAKKLKVTASASTRDARGGRASTSAPLLLESSGR